MTDPVSLGTSSLPMANAPLDSVRANDDGKAFKTVVERLETMLWAEMLSHAGLEEAFTKSGGEAASAFSRLIVESIAEDLASKHSFNFGDSAAMEALVQSPTKAGERS